MKAEPTPSLARRPHHWSFPVGRVGGIEIRVHVSFLVLVALFALAAPQPGTLGALASVGWLLVIFGCVVVHELSHSFVARARGAEVEEILLFPLGGVSKLHNLPESPKDEFAIAIVGPLASIGLGLAAAGLCLVTGRALVPIDLLAGAWLARFAWLNLILGVFNLLPAFPLDGGRVLRSLLERTHDLETATRTAARVGRMLAVALMVTGLLLDVWLTLIGLFVYFGATAEEAATIVHVRLQGHHVREVMRTDIDDAVPTDEVVDIDALLDDDLLTRVQAAPGHRVAVKAGDNVVGMLRLEDIGTLVNRAPSAPPP
ncbi:MAG: site-2 protease family protein [Acidimicrobiia bacterium]